MAYTGPKKFSKKVKTKSGRTKTVRYGAKGYSISPGTKKGDILCPVSWADAQEPESSQEPQLTAPLVTQEVEVQRSRRS